MSRSYSKIEEKEVQCNLSGQAVSISVERGLHMGRPVTFVSECEYRTLRNMGMYCSRLDKPCPYSADGGRAQEFFN